MLFAKCFSGFPQEGVEVSTFIAIPTKLGKQDSPPYVPWLGHTHVASRKGPASSQDLHLRKKDCFVPLQNLDPRLTLSRSGIKVFLSGTDFYEL